MRRRWLLWTAATLCAALVAVVVVLVTVPNALKVASRLFGHGSTSTSQPPEPVAGADLSGTGPGTLISAMTMPAITQSWEGSDLRAARVVYRSTSGDTGEPTVVSGSVFTPLGDPPEGGWPVVALGHGSTGIDEPCAPSLSGSLLSHLNWVSRFVEKGYAVTLADFQGLGMPGIHPYTDGTTAGLNIIDSVRALRRTFPGVSEKWAAFGGSQGAGAVWGADEQAASYAPELDLVGVVAASPAADVSGLVEKSEAGTLTAKQGPAYQWIIESLARLHPDLNRDDYRRGGAAKYWDALSACSGAIMHDRPAAMAALGPNDLAPATPEAAARMQQLLQKWALPQKRLSAPLSVVYGGEDLYIDPEWTTDAISRACGLGGTVVWQFEPNKGHSDVSISEQLGWIADRFAGKPLANQCPKEN